MPALINCPRLFRLMVRCRVFVIFSGSSCISCLPLPLHCSISYCGIRSFDRSAHVFPIPNLSCLALFTSLSLFHFPPFHVFFFSCVLRVFRFPFQFQLGWDTVGTPLCLGKRGELPTPSLPEDSSDCTAPHRDRVFSASSVFHFSSNQDGTRLVLLSALENGGNPRHLLFQKIVRTAPHRTENGPLKLWTLEVIDSFVFNC